MTASRAASTPPRRSRTASRPRTSSSTRPPRRAIAPADCVVVEDSPPGVEAARAAGMRVLGFGEELDADIVFTDMADLPHLLVSDSDESRAQRPRGAWPPTADRRHQARGGRDLRLRRPCWRRASTPSPTRATSSCCCWACGARRSRRGRGAPLRARQGALLLDLRGRVDAVLRRRAGLHLARASRACSIARRRRTCGSRSSC